MSSFGINLDLRLNGQTALDRAIRGAKSLETIVKRLKDTPLDLSNIGGAARLDEGRLGKARKEIIAFAKELKSSQKPLANTEAGIREYVSAFSQLAANTKAGTPAFNAFVGVVAKAEKELEDLATATENAKRAQLGLLSVEEEAAELAAKEQQAKAKAKEAKARRENERQAQREAAALKRANRQREREAQLAKRQRGRAVGDLAASVGFPLLFGGGVGSVAGGAIGSIAGSALGLGFGTQIIGSAFGQQLDKAAEAANTFALEATKAATSLDTLVKSFGLSGTRTAGTFRFADTLGIGGAARAAAQGGLIGIVGEQGVTNLEKLANSAEDAGNALNRFGAATTATFAPILINLNQAVAGLFGGISKTAELDRLTDPANQPSSVISGPGAGVRGEFANVRAARDAARVAELSADPEVKAELELNQKILTVVSDRVKLAEKTANLEASRLTSRRDTFAVEEGSLAIQAQQNKLDVLAIQLGGKLEASKRRELELERDLTKEALRQAEEAQRNSEIEAQRAIARDISSNEQAILQTFQSIGSVQRASLKLTELEGEAFERNQTILKGESQLRIEGLELQREQALVGKNEQELRDRINEKFDLAIRLEKQSLDLQLEKNRQAEVLRQNREQEVKDNRELLRLETERNAMLQIRSMNFGRKFELSGAGLGFFGESENFQEETFARSAAQLEAYNEQIGRLQQRIQKLNSEGVDPDIIRGQQFKLDDLIAVRDTFREIQPAIDAAAVAQARFTDAMAVTVPVTDALFTNLVAVVQGTKTAEEAFASFLQSVAKMLMDVATQMIATYMAIGIARAFAGMGNDGGSHRLEGVPASPAVKAGYPGNLNYAEGGFVSGPTRALVGEGGESEYIIPESKMRESMARYSRGARGSSVIPETGASGTSGEGGGVAVAAPIDVRYSIERINNIDYVTNDQFQQGLQQAAAQGAQRGEQNTLKRLQMSGSTRRRLGM